MTDAPILYEQQGKIAIITLNRPDRINAFNDEMVVQLNEAVDRFATDESVWVAIIRGAGERGFSSGADLKSLKTDPITGQSLPLPEMKLCARMVTAKPIVAAVHGYCIGEGIYLVLACDMVFATPDSRFYIPEARVGVNAIDIPLQLAHKMTYNQAYEFLMGLEPASAAWCQRAGLVNQISDNATEAALAWADRLLAETAPLAVRGMKETLWQAVQNGEPAGRTAGLNWRQTILTSADWQEGLAAFKAKRKPQFKGK